MTGHETKRLRDKESGQQHNRHAGRPGFTYELPNVREEAKKQNYTEEAIYSYSSTGSAYSFTFNPNTGFSFGT